MNIVIPLAGPDFIEEDGAIKPLRLFASKPLLKHVLESRVWARHENSLTFILRDTQISREFMSCELLEWYPGSSVIYLSSYSRGAACSALAGISLQNDPGQPLVIDLADIIYKSSLDISKRLHQAANCGGIALAFKSTNPIYSYLELDSSGKLVKAAEKCVISEYASAGTYVFRDSATFLRSIAHAYDNERSQTYNDLFYVCPLFNGVLAQGMDVEIEEVYNVIDPKTEPKAYE